VRKSLYNEFDLSSNADLCHLTTVHVYYMIFWLSKASQSSQIGLINRELTYIYVSDLKVAAFPCQVDDLIVQI